VVQLVLAEVTDQQRTQHSAVDQAVSSRPCMAPTIFVPKRSER
jgi:hypothetical protein